MQNVNLTLEQALNIEVEEFLRKSKEYFRIESLSKGEISPQDYIALLRSFFIFEYLSAQAVTTARNATIESNPFLSQRFNACYHGEIGHAKIALDDLKALGIVNFDETGSVDLDHFFAQIANTEAVEFRETLLQTANSSPHKILGYSYLLECASGLFFPQVGSPNYPANFVAIHAKEDPVHSKAIKRTIKLIDPKLTENEKYEVAEFARQTGERYLGILRSL